MKLGKITAPQQRILNLLSDNKPHALIPELEAQGFRNQICAIQSLEAKLIIEFTDRQGYRSLWRLSDYYLNNKHIIDTAMSKNPAAVALGRLGGLVGGKVRASKLTPQERREIAQKAARCRWGYSPLT